MQTVAIRPPLYASRVSAGFPSPADDYIDKRLDLNDLLVPRRCSFGSAMTPCAQQPYGQATS